MPAVWPGLSRRIGARLLGRDGMERLDTGRILWPDAPKQDESEDVSILDGGPEGAGRRVRIKRERGDGSGGDG